MVLKFWGAARTVTESMHLLQLDNGKNILLECGLYQGSAWIGACEALCTRADVPPAHVTSSLSHPREHLWRAYA